MPAEHCEIMRFFKNWKIIDERFLQDIGQTGPFAQAIQRLADSQASVLERLPAMSIWGLICEEIVDTEHDQQHYDRVLNELLKRGLTVDQIHDMRRLAWRTAGWLNFDMMMWDWVSLDEKDILKAAEMLRDRKQ